MPDRLLRSFCTLFGVFLALALLKFGNPPIMERWVESPANIYEVLLGSPWPISWGYALLACVSVFGLVVFLSKPRPPTRTPMWVALAPLAWLVWQGFATSQSISSQLSIPTLKHFVACVVCFYLGFGLLSRTPQLEGVWPGLVGGFVLVLVVGWQQHFGGLEETRQFFFREIYPHLKEVTPEYLKKMSSTRIFSTLFYPNALAGALLLFVPAILACIANARGYFTFAARLFLSAGICAGALGCLYWSGSKGGWLLMLLLVLIFLLRLPFARAMKIGVLVAVVVLGLAGFIWKYAGFFERGATSVGARMDYWQAALKTATAHPAVGTGPGTFMIPYAAIKRPESEMTRMVHNDYLEQASDSGWLGFVAYTGFIVVGLTYAGRRAFRSNPAREGAQGPHWVQFSIWLGLLGWAVQSCFEFPLYLPALAWPAFAFMGFLLAQSVPTGNSIDKPKSPR